MNQHLQDAIRLAGGQEALASKIGVGQSLVSYWLKKAKKGVSPEFAPAIEEATGIPCHQLRPDVFRRPSIQDQPASASDRDVVVADGAEQVDLHPEEHPDRVLPSDDVRAGDAAGAVPACEPADSH
jgi:DNA-binding transcriptional regulator YdaS (Cro superfamily)